MDRFRRPVISEALVLTGGNRSQPAKTAGLSRPPFMPGSRRRLKLETTVKSLPKGRTCSRFPMFAVDVGTLATRNRQDS